MTHRNLLIKASLACLVVVTACSVLKKNDPDKDARLFLESFQKNLALTDQEILRQFDARQTQEALLTFIHILQNKESEFIESTVAYGDAQISVEDRGVKVVIPATFKSKNLETDYDGKSSMTLWLKPSDDSFVISAVEADEFYKAFADIRNNMQWSVERKLELRNRESVYAVAKILQMKFDSVVWYTKYHGKNYFYVISGQWQTTDPYIVDAKLSGNFKMGLVDDEENVIIPVEYDLVGSLGFDMPMIVEVRKENHVGYFNIETKQLVLDIKYDIIFPYHHGDVLALVKQDSTFGWMNKDFKVSAGFPSSEAEQWIKSYAFIPNDLKLKGDSVLSFCEIPNEENAGNGILIPPSYLVKTGLFNAIVVGISTTPIPVNGWTDYVKTEKTLFESISENLNAVMTTITKRYIEGREEFYTYNRMVLVNDKQDTLSVADISTTGKINFTRKDSTLLEVRYLYDAGYDEGGETGESNIPSYLYFALSGGLHVTTLTSHRAFAPSQFVKLDSSYLSGNFNTYNEATNQYESKTFLSLATVEYFRDEILADYGYKFVDEDNRFKYNDWYKSRYDKVEEFESQMTEIDRYNLAFFEKIITLLKQKPAA